MRRVHRHPRLLSALAFGLLALVAELLGRSLTHRVDLGRHVAAPSYSGAEYYPILLGVVKGAIALLLARLLWRPAQGPRGRAGGAAAARLARAPAASAGHALAAPDAHVLCGHRGHLPRSGRRRRRRRRPLAALLALAAHVGPARVSPSSPYSARLSGARCRGGSPSTRSLRRPRSSEHDGSSAAQRRMSSGRGSCSPLLLAASSGWLSRAVRLPSLPDPAVAP